MGDRYWMAVTLSMLAEHAMFAGRIDRAVELVGQAVRHDEILEQTQASGWTQSTRLVVALASDHTIDVQDVSAVPSRDDWLALAAEALARSVIALSLVRSNQEQASAERQRATELLTRVSAPSYTGFARIAVGASALHAGDTATALDMAREAVQELAAAGMQLFVPDALDLFAFSSHDDATARRAIALAGGLRQQMGTRPQTWLVSLTSEYDDVAPQQMSLPDIATWVARGRGPRRRPATGWDSLTPAELSVVRAVAKGATNAEAAAQLFMSARTVSTHLSHVFAKLGVKTRSELAGIAATRLV
jgi:DNA-binding CsgD family transcriptional regulator